MRVSLHTFGCKLNQYETEGLAGAFRAAGHEVTGIRPASELYIVNTCTVTSKSEQKARRLIRKLTREEPNAVVIVTGCYAQTDAPAVRLLGPNVVCLPQQSKHLLLAAAREDLTAPAGAVGGTRAEALRRALERAGAGAAAALPFAYAMGRTSFHARAYLKVQDGCDYGCAYCSVPLARGPSVSREPAGILAEARALAASGYREIVLTGVNIASYEHGETGLAELLTAALREAPEVRFRLSSLEPDRIGGALLDAIRHERVCPHFHLPVQSGSDSVLRSMQRRYRSGDVLAVVRELREAKGDPFIAADLIAGFPGESAADHELTVALVEAAGFAQLHVFPFSRRPGTAAWSMVPRIAEGLRDERTRELRRLSARLHAEYVRRWLGCSVEVLVEEPPRGTSGNYLKPLLEGGPWRRGQVARVTLGGDETRVTASVRG